MCECGVHLITPSYIYIYIRILCLVSGTHVLVHLTLRGFSTYGVVHRCVCMVVHAQPYGYVFFVHVARLRVKQMRFYMR